jgi:hypothetical protein
MDRFLYGLLECEHTGTMLIIVPETEVELNQFAPVVEHPTLCSLHQAPRSQG